MANLPFPSPAKLERLGNVKVRTDGVDNEIIVGKNLQFPDAARAIQDYEVDQHEIEEFRAQFTCFPVEGAMALYDALKEEFQNVALDQKKGTGIFDPGYKPTWLQVPVGPSETRDAIWGVFKIRDISNALIRTSSNSDKAQCFIVMGECQRAHLPRIKRVIARVHELTKKSIYQGHIIDVDFGFARAERPFDILGDAPQFIAPPNVTEADLIFDGNVMRALEQRLFGQIKYLDAYRRNGMNLKNGVCLVSDYGHGKSLTASVAMRMAHENGWTFIRVKNIRDLEQALELAKTMLPAIVFAEDLDTLISSMSRQDLARFGEVIDGVDVKENPLMFLYTTNALNRIPRRILREGRTDSIVRLKTPEDLTTYRRLIRLYADSWLDDDADIDNVCERMLKLKLSPAAVRTVVENAPRAAISRTKGKGILGKGNVTVEDLNAAFDEYELRGTEEQEEYLRPDLAQLLGGPGGFISGMLGMTMRRIDPTTGEPLDEDSDGGSY